MIASEHEEFRNRVHSEQIRLQVLTELEVELELVLPKHFSSLSGGLKATEERRALDDDMRIPLLGEVLLEEATCLLSLLDAFLSKRWVAHLFDFYSLLPVVDVICTFAVSDQSTESFPELDWVCLCLSACSQLHRFRLACCVFANIRACAHRRPLSIGTSNFSSVDFSCRFHCVFIIRI